MFCFRMIINHFESVVMQKINPISFQGVKKNSPSKIETKKPITNPTTTQINNLSANSVDFVVNPILPTDYVNKSDLNRYKKAQKTWAKSEAESLGIPIENIMARMSKIKAGDPKTMPSSLALFQYSNNGIEINPIKEIINLHGGDENHIIHESTHGLLHNLRRAYAKQIPIQELYQETTFLVLNKMLQGEHYPILKGINIKEINGQKTSIKEPLMPPSLSLEERKKLVTTIGSIQNQHLETNTATLNEEGKCLVKKTLIPFLDEYPKTQVGTPEEVEEKVFSKMVDYINSFYTRRNTLINLLIGSGNADLGKNLETPLSEIEKKLAKKSLEGFLSTYEGNLIKQNDKIGLLDVSDKSYFMSFEELLARRCGNGYRQNKIDQKIKNIKAKGMIPSEKILKEKQIIENNINLLNLAEELDAIEKYIISAPKDRNKLIEINTILKQIKKTFSDPQIKQVPDFVQEISPTIQGKNPQEQILLIKNSLSSEKAQLFDEYLKGLEKLAEYNQLNTPVELLADTAENTVLKTKFNTILGKIKNISMDCDLSAIPKFCYKTKADFIKANENTNQIILKWMKRLK